MQVLTDCEDIVRTLEATWRSLLDLGATLTDDEWARPTDCPGWSVQDQFAHVLTTERMLEGLPMATDHPTPDAPHVRNDIGRMNEREVDSRRHLRGGEVLAELADVVAQRSRTFATGGDAYFAQEAFTPTGPGTVLDFLSIRILDCWVHEQDVRRAVGRPGNLDGPAAEHTLGRLVWTLPIVVGKRAGTPEGGTVVFRLTGPVEAVVPVTVEDGRAKVVADAPADPLVEIALDSEAFLVLATGRRTAAALADRITVTGDTALGQRVVEQLNMMI